MKVYLSILIVFTTLSVSAQKRFHNSIHVDFFGNQVDGDGRSGYNHVGLHAGLGALYKFKDLNGALGFEINYAQKGARVWPKPQLNQTFDYIFNLNYVEVPIYYVFEKWGLPFEIGPTFSYLLGTKYEFNGVSQQPNGDYRQYELGGMFSLNYKITSNLYFKFRITNSITPILNIENGSFSNLTAGSWHRGGGLNITYYFRDPFSKSSNLNSNPAPIDN